MNSEVPNKSAENNAHIASSSLVRIIAGHRKTTAIISAATLLVSGGAAIAIDMSHGIQVNNSKNSEVSTSTPPTPNKQHVNLYNSPANQTHTDSVVNTEGSTSKPAGDTSSSDESAKTSIIIDTDSSNAHVSINGHDVTPPTSTPQESPAPESGNTSDSVAVSINTHQSSAENARNKTSSRVRISSSTSTHISEQNTQNTSGRGL